MSTPTTTWSHDLAASREKENEFEIKLNEYGFNTTSTISLEYYDERMRLYSTITR